ncbi:MAG: 1-acyl-sn-glycerol-3-phosphate acyltransferase [Acidimicrobiia bacterium]|nr:1-acyl-sn-glycerol-3-phosphate acyltransferase [Acidimicrobiia bacterium]
MTDEPVEVRPGREAKTWLGPPSRLTRFSYAGVRSLFKVVFALFGRVKVIGGDKIPTSGAFVLAPVHRSNVDFALASLVTGRPMRFMGKDSIWKVGLLGRFVSMLGAFPVHRGAADRESLRVCTTVIVGGSPLVMFPEGQRRTGPVVEELFDGTSFVAARTGVPIIPVGIGGSERMMPKGARFLHPSRLVLLVGDPIPAPAATDKGRVSRSAVRDLTLHLRTEMQRLFDEAQVLAGRPNQP